MRLVLAAALVLASSGPGDARGAGEGPTCIATPPATTPGQDFLGLIAVMRKEQGADPAQNDWRFVEFTREGRRHRFTETASGAICWTCHMRSAKTD
jgi:hypothetical protein